MFTLFAAGVLVLAVLALGYTMGWDRTVKEGESIIRDLYKLINGDNVKKRNLAYIPKINADEKHTQIILSVLYNIDERVINHINSITVLPSSTDVSLICGAQAMGCASTISTPEIKTDISIASVDNFIGSCGNFEHVLYHEIGHVEYQVLHNDIVTDREVEYYVESFADKYKKDSCVKSLRLFH